MTRKEEIYHLYIKTARRAFSRNQDILNDTGLHRGQPKLIYALWDKDGQSRKELVESLGIQPATVTKMINRLSENGFIESRQDSEDGRINRVYLTKKGRAVKEPLDNCFLELREELFEGFSEEDLEKFSSMVERIRNNLPKGCCKEKMGGRHR